MLDHPSSGDHAMDNRDLNDSTDGRIERAKDQALGKHDDDPSVADEVGEGVGGIGGMLAGAAIGTAGGPIGTLIGGIAGAVGGWWAGRAVTEAASAMSDDDDAYYRSHYESSPNRLADRRYEDVRPAYQLGHVAAQNPDYANRSWTDIESDLQHGWSGDASQRYGEWSTVRNYANEGFNRGRASASGTAARTDRTVDRAGDAAENAWDRTKAGAERMGDKIADAADDMKDRMDGNPASRPGVDATDSPRRADR
jgi:phage tail tape-measure protein